MAFLLSPSNSKDISPQFDRASLTEQLRDDLEREGLWDVYVNPTPCIDALLIRTLTVHRGSEETGIPLIPTNALTSFQQVVAVRFEKEPEPANWSFPGGEPPRAWLILRVSSCERAHRVLHDLKEKTKCIRLQT